ncbi:MAG: hypothetical protein O3C60_11330, partial [Planctomycetota bacterium]|nr:hypothetical protein [Planctomycetota bacterium]
QDRRAEVRRVAAELFRQTPDWVTFFREVLGVEGIVRKLFPSVEELASFEQSAEYIELQQMVARLRSGSGDSQSGREPTRVITVRLPKSLHESLRDEAHQRNTSMNKLCISKLLQIVDNELIPTDAEEYQAEAQVA